MSSWYNCCNSGASNSGIKTASEKSFQRSLLLKKKTVHALERWIGPGPLRNKLSQFLFQLRQNTPMKSSVGKEGFGSVPGSVHHAGWSRQQEPEAAGHTVSQVRKQTTKDVSAQLAFSFSV